MDDDELMDSSLKGNLKGLTCPVCEKVLSESIKRSMLRVVLAGGRVKRRIVAPGETGTCPTCKATLKLRFGTTLGLAVFWLCLLFSLPILVIGGYITGGGLDMIYVFALCFLDLGVGTAVGRLDNIRHRRVLVVDSKRSK